MEEGDKMIEYDLAHLRFLHNIAMKGEYLTSDDIAFILGKKQEFKAIVAGIEEILETQRMIEEML